ncbi:MAG: glycosyltransferase [Bacteroidota bacterium]
MPSGLSILVPAYNEEQTIVSILEILFQTQLPDNMIKEVIVVNDCSTDKTPVLLDDFASRHPELPLRILHCPRNQGKSAAIPGILENADFGPAPVPTAFMGMRVEPLQEMLSIKVTRLPLSFLDPRTRNQQGTLKGV